MASSSNMSVKSHSKSKTVRFSSKCSRKLNKESLQSRESHMSVGDSTSDHTSADNGDKSSEWGDLECEYNKDDIYSVNIDLI